MKKSYTLNMPKKTWRGIYAMAKRDKLTMSEFIEQTLVENLTPDEIEAWAGLVD